LCRGNNFHHLITYSTTVHVLGGGEEGGEEGKKKKKYRIVVTERGGYREQGGLTVTFWERIQYFLTEHSLPSPLPVSLLLPSFPLDQKKKEGEKEGERASYFLRMLIFSTIASLSSRYRLGGEKKKGEGRGGKKKKGGGKRGGSSLC